MRILLLEGIHPLAYDLLRGEGFSVDQQARALNENELAEVLQGYDILGIRSKTQVNEKILQKNKNLLAVGAFCIGTNQVDLTQANRLGIPVFNAPYSNTRSVAELVICEMIALSRQLGDINTGAHKRQWKKSAEGNHEIRGRVLGIVGYGHIGTQVSVLAESLGMSVIYYDIIKKLPMGNGKPVDSLETLLRTADFVTLHVPETSQTMNMMNHSMMRVMKKGSFLINASRGTVVVINDLVQALKSGQIGGAALDVFPAEPSKNGEEFVSELQGLPNVILTPHIGGSTEEAQEAIGREVVDTLIRFVRTGMTLGAVNFPLLSPPMGSGHRLTNVHNNVPGVLGAVNGIVSELGVNIKAQYLSTDAQIGYLVMDVEQDDSDELSKRIGGLKTSIKTRLLS